MVNAKFKIDFEIGKYFDIVQDEKINLYDNSQIVFHKSKLPNIGTIFFEIDQPIELVDGVTAEKIGKQRINQLLNFMSITFPIYSLEPIKFSQPELLNKKYFKRMAFQKTIGFHGDVISSWKPSRFKKAVKLYNQFNTLSKNEQDIISRSFRWLRKTSGTNGEDRFIYRWISFEILLGLLGKKNRTQKLITEFVNRYLDTNMATTISKVHQKTINDLSNANLVSYHRDNNYSLNLKERLKKNFNPRDFLPQAMICVFEVRNNLFHVGSVSNLMKDSCLLLEDIYSCCLSHYILQNLSRKS